MKKLISVLLALCMLLALCACGAAEAPEAPAEEPAAAPEAAAPEAEAPEAEEEEAPMEVKETFVIGVDVEFTSLAPVTTGTEGSLIFRNGVYETLFIRAEDGTVQPWLAESYEWRDDTTLVIKLNEGVTFHNGNPFTASDVLYSIKCVAETPTAASRVGDIILEESFAEDDYTVVFKTKGYSAVLVGNLSGELICMMDEEFSAENPSLDQVANGTGPYCLDAWNMGVNCVITKNENYWNSEVVDPYFKNIDIRFFNDNTTAFLEYENGTLDAVYVENNEAITRLVADEVPNTYYCTEGTNFVTSLFMSQNVGEMFKDINLRMAIAHAIDVPTLVSAICGPSVQLADSMFPSGMPGYKSMGNYEYNEELANQYMDAYKAAAGVDSIDVTATLPATGYNEKLAEGIQQYLSKIGINMTIQSGAVSDIIPLMMSGTASFGISQCGGGDDPADMFVAMRRTTANLLTKYADPTILDLIDNATYETDWDTRMGMYETIQETTHENYYLIPLYEVIHYYAVSDAIGGFVFGTGHGVMPAYLTQVK